MNILILGATGRVGQKIVENALSDGHHVHALVRSPAQLEIKNEHLSIFQGNVVNEKDIRRAIDGCDMVISALSTDGGTALSDSIHHIITTMKEKGIKRIVAIGTAGILQSRGEPDKLRYETSESRRSLTRAAKEHFNVYEALQSSGLDWTIVCPTYLPDGEAMGHYRVEKDFLPEGGKKINVDDVANFAYAQLTDTAYNKSRVGIAY